jgi:hypothetical protein
MAKSLSERANLQSHSTGLGSGELPFSPIYFLARFWLGAAIALVEHILEMVDALT